MVVERLELSDSPVFANTGTIPTDGVPLSPLFVSSLKSLAGHDTDLRGTSACFLLISFKPLAGSALSLLSHDCTRATRCVVEEEDGIPPYRVPLSFSITLSLSLFLSPALSFALFLSLSLFPSFFLCLEWVPLSTLFF